MQLQRPLEHQPQLRRGKHPSSAAAATRRRAVCVPRAAARQLQLAAPARGCESHTTLCHAACEQAEETEAPTNQRAFEGRRGPAGRDPPPGVEANNAITLRRRRRQQAEEAAVAAAAATASAQNTLQAVTTAGPASETTAPPKTQPPIAAELDARPQDGDAPGSVLGAIALITGSTVGAGILALPQVAAPAGFGPSTAVMGACWVLLASQAMLLAEVNIGVTAIRAQERVGSTQPAGQQMVTLRQMAGATLGRAGGAAASVIYLLLSFSLLTAYIAKAGEMVGTGSPVDPSIAGAAFTAALGGMMCLGGASTADSVNRWLTGALMLVFGGILAFGAGHADASLLTATADWQQAPRAIPIIFLALVFHDLVPVVCAQLGGHRRRVRAALLSGSLLPLAMFVAWDATMLALTGEPGSEAPADPLAVLIADSGGAVGVALQGFSLLALATSFIGTCTGLTSTLQSEYAAVTAPATTLHNSSASQQADADSKPAEGILSEGVAAGSTAGPEHSRLAPQALVYIAALSPPLAAASLHPGSFLTLLSAAGGYGMSFLYGVMPPVMAWQLRSKMLPGDDSRHWMPGGRGLLAVLCTSAVAVEIGQAAMSCGWLP